jgi:hypothetical protein
LKIARDRARTARLASRQNVQPHALREVQLKFLGVLVGRNNRKAGRTICCVNSLESFGRNGYAYGRQRELRGIEDEVCSQFRIGEPIRGGCSRQFTAATKKLSSAALSIREIRRTEAANQRCQFSGFWRRRHRRQFAYCAAGEVLEG